MQPRDRWIGWDFRHQYDRLHLIANNARFLILPGHHYPNLASRILSLCERRLAQDWPERFGHPLWLLETFVDPRYFHGTIYRAANWEYVGDTRGFRRTRTGYSATAQAPKRVFVRPLIPRAQARLSQPVLDPAYHHGAPKLMLSAEHMRSLPAFFADIPDPRRAQGTAPPLAGRAWLSPPLPCCAGRAATRPSAHGHRTWGRRPVPAFAAATATAATRCPAVPSSAMCSPRVDPDLLDRALQGLERAVCRRRRGAWPSTAKPCATPSTRKVAKPISSASSAMTPGPATLKLKFPLESVHFSL